jgi:uncharacterized protein YxeA
MTKHYYIILFVILVIICYMYINYKNNVDGFTPHIRGIYRPYMRVFNNKYEYFINEYGPHVVWNKLRKWNIY